MNSLLCSLLILVGLNAAVLAQPALAKDPALPPQNSTSALLDRIHLQPGLFKSLTEPPCSYCSTQNRKGLVTADDPVLAWIRGAHNGGAIPIRHFLAAPRVINDTYGLFFYDPDGGYVSAFKKDYGFEFLGWRNGIMVVRGPDDTVWSALTGLAMEGPKKGQRLERIPSLVTTWGNWLMLHPESTAYDLFDGKRYPLAQIPAAPSDGAVRTLLRPDSRLEADSFVHGVEANGQYRAFPLDSKVERGCFQDEVNGVPVAVLWYALTRSSVAFDRRIEGRVLNFYADDVSPETAPFKDRETGSRWTLAGRAVDGPMRGRELSWIPSVQCKWYAWAAEYSQTTVYAPVP